LSDSTIHADPETLARIAQAQRHAGRPLDPAALPFRHLGHLVDAQAESRGADPYLIFYEEETEARRVLSFEDLRARVNAVAAFLAGPLGLRKGERLATLLVNEPETLIVYLAAMRVGAVVVPINVAEEPERVRYILEHSEARALVAREDSAAKGTAAGEGLAALQHRAQIGGKPSAGYVGLETSPALADAAPACLPDLDHGDEALIVYTSGTTAAPKGVVLTHGNLLIDAWAIARWHRLGPSDKLMCVLPIHHVNGLVVTLLTPLLAGASTVLNRRFRTATFWKRIKSEEVSVVSVVPTLLQFLCEAGEEIRREDIPTFRHVICGAGPLTVDLARRFEETFRVPIMHGYGLSETTCYNCFLPIDLPNDEHTRWLTHYGFPSIGVPIACNEMAIHDESGKALGPGARGEIVIRGWDVMRYYFGRPEVNRETFAHGWFRSGDEGFFERDAQGRPFFFITGRLKELIIRGGVNISPFEIDEVLNRIPGVARGLAVGFDNDWYGEEVGAYVKREEGASVTEEEILAACRDALPFHKRPKCVVFGEDIPVTSTGKYQRIRLKPLFVAWKAEQFRDRRKR
jgi:long-chain acyl-CoA synthetase